MIDWKRFFKRRTKEARNDERRFASRRRTKLRPGKIVDSRYAFIADCAILDRSASGLRLRTFAPLDCDDEFLAVFDDHDRLVCSGRVAWRRDNEIGLALSGTPDVPDEATLRKLSDRYYAIGD